ncbi:NAD(P)/FAD-dependent oxidoreductase [Dietzia sp. NPDC055877]
MSGRGDETRDVVVIGGGAAGLSGAVTLARARRSVTVVDAGEPRNAPAEGVHGLLAREGMNPSEFVARGREEVEGYGGEIRAGEVVDARAVGDGFEVSLRDGTVLPARTLLIATGVADELPAIPGLREQWGNGVLHCPYCHGWEVRDRRIGVLATGPMSGHQAVMFHQWSPRVTYFAGGRPVDDGDRRNMEALGIPIVEGEISRVESDGGRVVGVRVDDDTAEGGVTDLDAVVVSTRLDVRTDSFGALGLEVDDHPVGSFIKVDDFGATSVPGVWAAGNCADVMAQVGLSAAQGTRAAQHINAMLIMADLERAVEARGSGAHR